MSLCMICHDAKQKYKCPKCMIPYCSLLCYKSHQCNLVNPTKVQEEDDDERQIIKSEYVDEEVKLPPKKLQLLSQSKKIRSLLGSQKLRKKLIEIDNSKIRMNELNHEMKVNKDFEQFCHLLLKEMGYMTEEGVFQG